MKRWLTGVIVAVAVLVAGKAGAECAWVLWAELPGKVFSPVAAVEDRTECVQRAAKRMQDKGDETLRHFFQIDPSEMFYRCLPDTVDPRGPRR